MTSVPDWLQKHKLEAHVEAFDREGITIEMLPTLSDEDLKQLGLTTIAARRTFRDATGVREVGGTLVAEQRGTNGGMVATGILWIIGDIVWFANIHHSVQDEFIGIFLFSLLCALVLIGRGLKSWKLALRLVVALLIPAGAFVLYGALHEGDRAWKYGDASSTYDDEHQGSAILAAIGTLGLLWGMLGAAPTFTRRFIHLLRHRAWPDEPAFGIGRTMGILAAIAVVCGLGDYGVLAIGRMANQIEDDESRAQNAKAQREREDAERQERAATEAKQREEEVARQAAAAKAGPTSPLPTAGVPASMGPSLSVTTVTASSTLPPTTLGGVSYTFAAGNLVDGRLDTSWQPTRSGGASSVRLNYATAKLTTLRLANGFQKQDSNGDMYAANRRVAKLTLTSSSGWTQVVDVADQRGWQVLAVADPSVSSWVELRIDATHDAARWPDVAVSEIQLGGSVSTATTVTPTGALPAPSWVIALGAFPDAAGADAFIAKAAQQGHTGLSRLWIPDWPSLSGRPLFVVYEGPVPYAEKDVARQRVIAANAWSPGAYGVKLDRNPGREEIRP